MLKYFVALALLATSAMCTVVSEVDGVPFPIEVNIEGCEEEPCDFVKGKDVIMYMKFKAPKKLTVLTPDVLAKALGVSLHYPLNEKNGCLTLVDAKCPVEEGQTVEYKMVMPILAIYPTIPLELTFTLADENKESLYGFKVDANVVSN